MRWFSSAWMSAARPVSVTDALLSPPIVMAWPPEGVKLVCAPEPATSTVPLGAEIVTVTGVLKAADSGSATTKGPVIRVRVSSLSVAAVGPEKVAASLALEARSVTVVAAMLGSLAGTATVAPQS